MIGFGFSRVLFGRDHNVKVLWLAVLGVALLMSACGGGDSEESGLTVSSPDGMATLVIAEGSLPEGVSIDDIQVDFAEGLSDEPGAPLAAVRLSPSGLKLSQTASLYIEIPDGTDQLLVVHVSGEGFAFASMSGTPSPDEFDGTIDVDHFSVFFAYSPDAFAVTGSSAPDSIYVGDIQQLDIQADLVKPNFLIWMAVDAYAEQWQLFEYEITSIALAAGDYQSGGQWLSRTAENGSHMSRFWEPSFAKAEVAVQGTSSTASALSRCTASNDEDASIWMHFDVTSRLVGKGEIVDGHTKNLTQAFGGVTKDGSVGLADLGSTEMATPAIGDTKTGSFRFVKFYAATCLASAVDDTTSSSSTSSTSAAGQGSGSTSDVQVDPAGDLVQAFPEFDRIDGERTDGEVTGAEFVAAVDFVQMEVTSTRSTNSETVISLKFSGPAELMPTEISGNLTSREFGVDVLIHRPTGRVLNVIYNSNGKIKISDIPSGMSITSEWLTPDELRIFIVGLALDPGTQVEANLLLEAYGGIDSDSVELTTTGG